MGEKIQQEAGSRACRILMAGKLDLYPEISLSSHLCFDSIISFKMRPECWVPKCAQRHSLSVLKRRKGEYEEEEGDLAGQVVFTSLQILGECYFCT